MRSFLYSFTLREGGPAGECTQLLGGGKTPLAPTVRAHLEVGTKWDWRRQKLTDRMSVCRLPVLRSGQESVIRFLEALEVLCQDGGNQTKTQLLQRALESLKDLI